MSRAERGIANIRFTLQERKERLYAVYYTRKNRFSGFQSILRRIVSAVSYGGIISTEPDTSDAYVSYAREMGVNYFDVAPSYGDAQLRLGKSLIPFRKDIYLACKTTRRDYEGAKEEAKESLKLLHTDYFDTYQLHGLSNMEELERAFSKDGVMKLLEELKASGTTRKVGITAHSEEVALKALSLYDFDSVLFPYNWHMNLSKGMGNRLLAVCKEKNVGILCMKSMIERAWTDKDEKAKERWPKSWCKPIDPENKELLMAALRYAAGLGVDTIIPPGNIHHFRFAAEHADEIFSVPLCAEEKKLLEDHLQEVKAYPFF